MPILWNEEILSADDIAKYTDMYMPKGRNKLVTFSLLNPQPFKVISTGKTLQKMGSEKQIPAFNRTNINGLGSGIMRYYESINDVPNKMGGFRKDFTPNYITFFKHNNTFDASKNRDLFFFLLHHSNNTKNTEATGALPEFQFNEPTDAAKKTVASIKLKADAFKLLEETAAKNKGQLRAFYESLGFTDYDDKVQLKDMEGILAPLYQHCESNPQDAIEKMNDAALDIISMVVLATECKILKVEGKSIYWGDHIKADLKKRKITDIPRGKESKWQDWFATNFLRTESDVANEVSTEVKAYQLGRM